MSLSVFILAGVGAQAGSIDQVLQLPALRLIVNEATGSGHQAATINVLHRLRQLGYKNWIEVIYPDSTADKLEYLYPPFRAVSSNKTFEDLRVRFVSQTEFEVRLKSETQKPEIIPLGITGADDYVQKPQDFRVQTLLTLQPFLWHKPARLQWAQLNTERSDFLNHQVSSQRLLSLAALAPFNDLNAIDNFSAEDLVQSLSHTHVLQSKTAALKYLVEHANELELAAIYGHDISQGQLTPYLYGLQYAAAIKPEKFRKKKVVVVFNELNPEEKQNYQLQFDGIRERGISVIAIDATNPNCVSEIASLQEHQMLVIWSGKISKPVFEKFYKISTLPPIVEGMNSMALMAQLGKPYLTSWTHEKHPFIHFSESLELAQSALYDHRDGQRAFGRGLAEFILESRTTNSKIQRLFLDHQLDQSDPRQDMVLRGLEYADEVMQRGLTALENIEIENASLSPHIRNARYKDTQKHIEDKPALDFSGANISCIKSLTE